MKATYKGWEVEGTLDEIRSLIELSKDSKKEFASVSDVPEKVSSQVHVPKTYKKRAPNKFHSWTKAEDEEMKRLYLGGLTSTQVAKKMGRTPVAIQARLSTIGVAKGAQKSSAPSSQVPVRRKRSPFPVRAWTHNEDEALKAAFGEFSKKEVAEGDVDKFDQRMSKLLQRSVKSIQQRRTQKSLVMWKAKRVPTSSFNSSSQVEIDPGLDKGALAFKEVGVDELLIESTFKHMIKMGNRLNWQNSGYMLGIDSSAKFREWMSAVLTKSERLAKYYGVPNKFKSNGQEIWYGA